MALWHLPRSALPSHRVHHTILTPIHYLHTQLHTQIRCFVQAIQLLMMYGADAGIENKYKQTPVYLTVDEKCIEQFETLEAEGELCRAALQDRLEDDRHEAKRLGEERAAAEELRYACADSFCL